MHYPRRWCAINNMSKTKQPARLALLMASQIISQWKERMQTWRLRSGFDHAMVVLPEVATTVTGPNMQSGQVCSTLSPETVIHLANSFHLADLRLTEPAIAHEIESISEDIEWLQCFWVACDRNQAATTAMIRSYASWRQDFKLDETRIAAILRAQLIEILPGGEAAPL